VGVRGCRGSSKESRLDFLLEELVFDEDEILSGDIARI
jgi:hypothetical protein